MLKMFGLLFVEHTLKNYMLLFSDFGAGLCPGSHRVPPGNQDFLWATWFTLFYES